MFWVGLARLTGVWEWQECFVDNSTVSELEAAVSAVLEYSCWLA